MSLQSVEASNWLPGPKLFPPGCLQYPDPALRLAGLWPLIDRRQAHPGHQPADAMTRPKTVSASSWRVAGCPRKWDHLRVQNSFDHLCHNNGINNGNELHRYEGILFSLMQRAPSIQLCLAFVFVGFVTE